MKKILLIIYLLLPSLVFALDNPEINSKNAIIYDLTEDKVLYNLNEEEQVSIASLTKIMTTITAINNIDNLDEEITITNNMLSQVRWDASIAGLKVGDKVTYRDLLYASILPSGADATTSIAIATSNTVDNYVTKMNELANEIGLKNTHFVNVTGLDNENHYSTVKDVQTLLKYALNNPTFKEIYTTKEYTLTNGLVVKSTINLYNKKINKDTSRILGSKTGFTEQAGLCITALFNSNNHDMILVTVRADNKSGYNVIDALTLINYIDNNYQDVKLSDANTLVKTLPVEDSTINEYEIYTNKDIIKYLPIDYDINNFKIEYDGLDKLNYNIKENTEIGKINYYYNNELINTDIVYLNTTIEKDPTKYNNKNNTILIIIITFIILIIISIIILKRRKVKLK